jgi:hypothetical protein
VKIRFVESDGVQRQDSFVGRSRRQDKIAAMSKPKITATKPPMSILESASLINVIRGLIIGDSKGHPQSRRRRIQTNLRGDLNSSQ